MPRKPASQGHSTGLPHVAAVLYALQTACCLLPLQVLVEDVFSVNWLQLLKITYENQVRTRAQLAEGNLKAPPHVSINLADLIQNDQVVVS